MARVDGFGPPLTDSLPLLFSQPFLFVVWNIPSSSALSGQTETTCSLHIYDFRQFSSVLSSALPVKSSPNSASFKYTFLYKCSSLSKISCPTARRYPNKKPPLCSGNESPYKQQSFFFNDKITHLKRHGHLNVFVRNGQNILKPNIYLGNVHLNTLGK